MKEDITPPRLAQQLFDWFCSDAYVEDLRGDIDELFYINLQRMPARTARFRYWLQTLSLITSYAVKKRKQPAQPFSSTEYSLDMLRSYFVIATRSLAKHKFFTIINVVGLAIGMSISLLLIAMMTFVSTYDDFHVNKERIYRVITKTNLLDTREYATAPVPLAEKLKDEYPGLEKVIRIHSGLSAEAEFNNRKIPLQGYFTDPDFLNVFTFPLLKGNASTALEKPFNLLITEAGAERMFGTEDPMGKVVKMGALGEFEITGVLKNPPKNSHMQFEIIAPHQALEIMERARLSGNDMNLWANLDNTYIYLLLPPGAKGEDEKIGSFMNRVAQDVYRNAEEFKASFTLQPFTDITPGPDLRKSLGISWDYTSFSIFGVLTLLILLPACFNYTNISISRALKRSKEIGLRKVVGGQRNQIFFQFILETILITLLALGASYFIFEGVRNEFSSMLVASQFLDLRPTAITWVYFFGFAIFVGLVAGAVPALYFSKLNPIQALKSKSSSKVSIGSGLRKTLVVGQFALSLGFIMAVGITAKQHIATLNYNYGFNQANILDVNLQGVDPNLFRNEFSKLSSVQRVSMSSNVMGASSPLTGWIRDPEAEDSTQVFHMFVDPHYLTNLDLTLVAGSTFDEQFTGREQSVIVNKEFLNQFKIATPADALNKTVFIPKVGELRIIGVVENFHYANLREPIQSFLFRYNPKQFNYANLKITSADTYTTMTNLEAVWKTLGGERKFEARFFDDEIEEAYSTYYFLIKICGFLGFLAITISCLGLLGMVIYTTETRTKEIGVRKVMGASTGAIALLLSKDYVKLMLIAAVIATPVTYFLFDAILSGTQYYQIQIGAIEIVLSLFLMLLLGVGTILSQTLKAARANPVDTLRNE